MKKLIEKNENPLVRRSKEMIAKAFFERLRENPYKKIRISDICERAGVSRSTFYKHYDQVEDVPYKYYVDDWLEKLDFMVDDYLEKNLPVDEIYTQGGAWILAYWENEVETYRLLKAAGMEKILSRLFSTGTHVNLRKFTNAMSTTIDPLLYDYYVALMGNIFFLTYDFWVTSGMKKPVGEMAAIMSKFSSYNLLNELAEHFAEG